MKILFYDLETTGLSRNYNEILNIAAIVYNDETDSIEAEFNRYIKPKEAISWNITRLTGITNEMVKNCSNEGLTLYEFTEWVRHQNCSAVAGHNIIMFDIPWIDTKCKKYTIENPLPSYVIDTLPMAKEAYAAGTLPGYNYTTEKGNLSFKQEYLMNYWDLGTQEHLALSDVQYDIQIYKKLKECLENQDYGF